MAVDDVLESGGESPSTLLVGKSDIVVQGLTSGLIKLQYLLQPTEALPSPEWTDFPSASFTSDTFSILFISEHSNYFKLVGVGNNSGVYVRMSGESGGGNLGDLKVYRLDFSKDYNSVYMGVM